MARSQLLLLKKLSKKLYYSVFLLEYSLQIMGNRL